MASSSAALPTLALLSPSLPLSPATSTASSVEDVSAVAPLVVCEECEERAAVADCEDCGLVYCAPCDKHRHRKGKLLFHQRKRIENLCRCYGSVCICICICIGVVVDAVVERCG
ncbi:hypothetical protein PINS_up004489 [Pythium insidiosum]|nr:hypothetical protein PINS_up004489 [Pythium insidiosum]